MPRSHREPSPGSSATPAVEPADVEPADVEPADGAAPRRGAPVRGALIRRRWSWRQAAGWLLLLVVCGRIAWTLIRDAALDPTGGELRSGPCLVSGVFEDGSLEVSQRGPSVDSTSRPFRVRLLGVRPMREHEAVERLNDQRSVDQRSGELTGLADVDRQATAWLRAAAVGRQAHLEFDRRRFDEQGRWLAYVAVDGVKLNVEWARAGWGRADGAPGDASAWRREIQRAEAEARRAARGGWRGASPELVPPRPRG